MPSEKKTTTYRKAVVWDYNAVFGASDELRCYRLSDQHVQALMSALTAMQWRTRWTDAPDDFLEILYFVGQLTYCLLTPTDCNSSDQPADTNGSQFGGGTFDDLLELLLELDMKFSTPDGTIYEPVIPLVPCGCGASDDQETNLDGQRQELNIPGSSSGATYGEFVTLCDAMTVLPGYLDTAWRDYLDKLNLAAQVGGVIGSANPFAQGMASGVLNAIDDLFDMLDSQSFQDLTRRKCLTYFADPWKFPLRSEIRGFAYQFPASFNGAPALSMIGLWAETADLDALDNAARAAKGTGNIDDCVTEFGNVGRVPFTNTTPTQVTPQPGGTLDVELVNDSGKPGLRLIANVVDINIANPSDYVTVDGFDGLGGNTIWAIGARIPTNSGVVVTAIYRRWNGSQGFQIESGTFPGGATGELSSATGLTTATLNEIKQHIITIAGYTPAFAESPTNRAILTSENIQLGGNIDVGSFDYNFAFIVIAPT